MVTLTIYKTFAYVKFIYISLATEEAVGLK